MKKEYVISTRRIIDKSQFKELEADFKAIDPSFSFQGSIIFYKIKLTSEDVMMFKLKYGHVLYMMKN